MFLIFLQSTLNTQNIGNIRLQTNFFDICQNGPNHRGPRKNILYMEIINLPWLKVFFIVAMQRTHFRNKFLKILTNQDRLFYTRQRNFCLLPLRKGKRKYSANPNEKDITDNSKSWHTVKLFLSDEYYIQWQSFFSITFSQIY